MERDEPRERVRAITGWGKTQRSALLTLVAIVGLIAFFLRDHFHRALPANSRLNVANPPSFVPDDPAPVPASGPSVGNRLQASESFLDGDADRPTGVVVDVRGGGIAGVEVIAGAAERGLASAAERRPGVRTDARGRFGLLHEPLGYELRHLDYFPIRYSWVSQERLRRFGFGRTGALPLPLIAFPGQRLDGRVRGPTAGVQGAFVAFAVDGRRWVVQSEADGVFASPLVPMMPVTVTVWHAEFCPVTTTVYPSSRPDPFPVGLTLQPGHPLELRVLAQDHTPIAQAEVFLRRTLRQQGASSSPTEKWRLVGWTDELGWLRTGWPSTPPFDVRVRAIGYRAAALAAVETTQPALFLHRAATVRGKAVDARSGLPVELSDVRLASLQDGEFHASVGARVALDRLGPGGFVLNLPAVPGRYRVSARSTGNAEGVSDPIDLDGRKPPEPLLVRVQTGVVFRGVVCGPNGPLAGVPVELLKSEHDHAYSEPMYRVRKPRVLSTTHSGDDGAFRFEADREVVQRVHAKVEGLGEYFSPPFCPPVGGDFVVALRPAATVVGFVKTPERRSVVGAEVRLAHPSGLWRSVRTDAAGRYEFRDVPGGEDFELTLYGGGSARPAVRRRINVVPGRVVVYNLKKRGTRVLRPPPPRMPRARPLFNPQR